MSDRNLTDDDVDAIVKALTSKVKEEFYADLGRGVWGVARKAVVVLIIAIAAYGSLKGYK